MKIAIEYFFTDESSKSLGDLSQLAATKAIQDFPWEEQIAIFTQSEDKAGPEVRFARHPQDRDDEIESYASVSKFEDGSWLIVAGSTMPAKILGIFPTTKKVDIIIDNLVWLDVENFVRDFYNKSRSDLFSWMKERE